MSFVKNAAVTGFGIGHFINATTGAAVTTGTPTCKRTLDGTGGACANAASYNTDGAVWEIDLAAGDMNGDMVDLSFTLTDCLPISYTIRTIVAQQTGDSYAVVNHADYGNAKLVRSQTPANSLAVGASHYADCNVEQWNGNDVSNLPSNFTSLSIDASGRIDLGKWLGGAPSALIASNVQVHTNVISANALNATAIAADAIAELAAGIEAAIINELDGAAVMQAIADLIAGDMTTTDLTVAAIASAVRDAVLNRVLTGNHDTTGSTGKLIQNLDAAISTRHASGAAVAKSPATLDWSADVSNKPTIGTSTLDAAGVRTAVGLAAANLDTQIATLATATNLATLDTLVDKIAPLLVGNVTGAGTGTEVYVYGGVTATVTVDVDGNVSGVVFS